MAIFAFKCCKCGRLHEAAHAGEACVPHACQVCGSGVTHTDLQRQVHEAVNTGKVDEFMKRLAAGQVSHGPDKKLHPDNWEVLADATPERLMELDLTADQVERHVPFGGKHTGREPQHVAVSVGDGPHIASNVEPVIR